MGTTSTKRTLMETKLKKIIVFITVNIALILGEPVLSQTFENKLTRELKTVDLKGIPASYLLTMAVLETGHGQNVLYKQAHNLFSFTQDRGGLKVGNRTYKVYKNDIEAINDLIRLLSSRVRYMETYRCATRKHRIRFFQSLQARGYAEDVHYSEKLERVYHELYK